ncbi:hypothetical protein CAMGR0001_1918 [Campylobacter gracilis RM3268]|uniref:Uncharacterized protein n=1 Tax=Campylobacter gracilis RM3268 TaxID=553220 RepID=C8PLA9_9BACT|nr:hypothetical protein CAMGR0001_1918 [Campylobacter gracilis RM3268]
MSSPCPRKTARGRIRPRRKTRKGAKSGSDYVCAAVKF